MPTWISANQSIGVRTIASRRLPWLLTALAWVGILIAYRDQVALIVEAWTTLPSHAHGSVVLVVVAYLAWTKRRRLAEAPLAPSMTGVFALLLSGAVGFAGQLVSAAVVVQFALVFMLMSAIWATLGDRAFRILFGPLCFLFFAIPFGQDALPVLMDWTADATVAWLRLSGVPVLQQDRSFVIPSGRWSVVEACSGIRYLLTSFFVGSIFAYVTYTRWYKRVLFVFWMLAASLLANWVRAYAIVMVAHLSNNQWGLGLSHLAFGWVIFAVTVVGSFYIGIRWSDPEISYEAGPAGSVARLPVIAGVALLTVLLAVGWQRTAYHFLNRPARPPLALDLSVPLTGLTPGTPGLPLIVPRFVGAAAIHQTVYSFDGGDIGLTVAYYRDQRQGAELINVNNLLEPTHNWAWHSSRSLPSMGKELPAMRLESYVGNEKEALVASLYWIGGYTTTSATASKIFQAINLASGRGDDGAMIVITTTDHTAEASTKRVEAFVRERLPGLLHRLDAMTGAKR